MTEILRMESNPRLSRILKYGDLIFLSGITSGGEGADIRAQTGLVLARLDAFLAEAGTDKSRLLSVQIWLRDIERDLAGMNKVWDAWVPVGAPARATCEARLGGPAVLIEIVATAAV